MTKDLCRETYAERSVGDRREAPGAHAESQQMSTGSTYEQGVRGQRRESAECGGQTAGILRWRSG